MIRRLAICACTCLAVGAAHPVLDAARHWQGVARTDDAYTVDTKVDISPDKTSSTTASEQATTTESEDTTTVKGGTTISPIVVPPTSTLFGSPFTTPLVTIPELTLPTVSVPTLTLPPSSSSSTATTVAPCPPCPQFDYTVLGASTVTNTGPTTVSGGVGLWPGTAVTGFPPGDALIDAASPSSLAGQLELTAAYLAAFLKVSTTTNAQLGGLTLGPGVYSGPSHMPLNLTGTLVLDGPGEYVFQTDSTLVTASGSRVALINGARACDIIWQVGSSATLGTGSVFAGNIMAMASITITTGVTLTGRALARSAAVTLDSDTIGPGGSC